MGMMRNDDGVLGSRNRPPPASPGGTSILERPRMSSLAITLNAAGVQVMPGQAASFGVEVRNLGTVVDRYRCEIVGMDPAWVTVSPASLDALPSSTSARGPTPRR